MSQQIINVGAVANDGTGESLRNAFEAVNNNFANIWAQGPVDSQVVITNNVVSTNVTNSPLVLQPNGIGQITVTTSVIPSVDSVFDLGNSGNYFDTVWARYYRGNAALMTGLPEVANLSAITTDLIPIANLAFDIGTNTQRWDTVYAGSGNFSRNVVVSGNLTVQGDIIEMGNTVTDSLTLHLGNSVVDPVDADGAGITVGANANIATILYNSDNNIWQTNVGLGTGNIVIQGDSIMDLAGPNLNNGDLTHGSTSGLDIVPNGSNTATVLYNTYGNVSIFASGTGANVHTFNFDKNGNASMPGNVSVAANVTADYFIGDGGQLSNISRGVIQSATAPSDPTSSTLWWDEVSGRLYVYYDDGISTQWVDAAPASGGGASGAINIDGGTASSQVYVTTLVLDGGGA